MVFYFLKDFLAAWSIQVFLEIGRLRLPQVTHNMTLAKSLPQILLHWNVDGDIRVIPEDATPPKSMRMPDRDLYGRHCYTPRMHHPAPGLLCQMVAHHKRWSPAL